MVRGKRRLLEKLRLRVNRSFILEERRRRAMSSRYVRGRTEKSLARSRAMELLTRQLTADQRTTLARFRFVDVESRLFPGRIYRIPDTPRQIEVFEQRQLTMHLCVQPNVVLPDADWILLQKLLLEADEERYLQTANMWEASRSHHFLTFREALELYGSSFNTSLDNAEGRPSTLLGYPIVYA